MSAARRPLADAARRIAGPRPLLKPSGAPAAQGGRALVQGVLGRFGYRLDRVLPYHFDAERVRLATIIRHRALLRRPPEHKAQPTWR